jgi:hypothetical protein
MTRRAGLEPATFGLEVQRASPLRQRRIDVTRPHTLDIKNFQIMLALCLGPCLMM